jgi:sporulation protein YabP
MVEYMTEKGSEQAKHHAVALSARQSICVLGVTEVESFDDTSVELITDCGGLTVEGETLHVGTLDIAAGKVEVTGKINGLYYRDKAPVKKGLRGRFLG